ncbi:hypothetical protein PInf_000756 [Phytophthora infestans]|nr:hypothetical protein PInf_000756 [Phytophthora infestans]
MKVFDDIAVHCGADPEIVWRAGSTLLDIIAQADDWNEKLEATNKIKEAKQVGIESSGELMRRLAMNESVAGDDDDENDDGEEDSDAASKVGR